MKRKVLLVVTKANWGGAQRYVFDLATHLEKESYDTLVAFGQRGALANELERAGIKTYTIRSLARDISFGADLKSFFELRQLFKKERPDIVHLNSSKVGGLGALAARTAGVPSIIFTAHGWPFWEDRNILAKALIWLVSWGTSLLAHKTICISEYDLRVARSMPFIGNKAALIYNGIDLHMPFGSGQAIRNAFPSNAFITGTVGELTHNKNQLTLIEEAHNKPDMHVAIVGEGELRGLLEQKIKDYALESRVKLFGFLPASEVMRGFDRFVLPSKKEGLPYVLLEARAAGLPITANRVGGVGEALDKPLEEFSLEKMVQQTAALYTTATGRTRR